VSKADARGNPWSTFKRAAIASIRCGRLGTRHSALVVVELQTQGTNIIESFVLALIWFEEPKRLVPTKSRHEN
jgi:hypothetical protein